MPFARGLWGMGPSLAVLLGAAALFLGVRAADAEQPKLLSEPGVSDVVVVGGIGDGGQARLGQVRVGDLNGDGFDDLLIGSPGSDANGMSGAGAIFVLFGRADRNAVQTVDLSFVAEYDLRIEGTASLQQLGGQLAIADVNGDGIDDAIFSAPGGVGALHIKWGSKTWPTGVISLSSEEAWDFRVLGEVEGSLLGSALCVGDLNADGRAELAFSVLGMDGEGKLNSTDVHLLTGRSAWPQRSYLLSERIPRRVSMVRRLGSAVRVVHTCALGDLDGNGAGDIALGMPLDWADEQEEAGSVSVIYDVLGHTGSAVDLADPEATWGTRILGSQAGARFGASLQIADFNGDHGADLAVGAPRRLINGPESEGALFLFWGTTLVDGVSMQSPSLRIAGNGGDFASVLDLGDFNADGRQDLLVAAPREHNYGGAGVGASYVYLSGPSMNVNAEQPAFDHRLVGSPELSGLGFSAAVGDLDGDGQMDWVLRASGHPRGRIDAGSVLVLPSAATRGKELSHSTEPAWTILGPGRGGGLWSQMRTARLGDDGKQSILWLSPEGGGDRGMLCAVSAEHTGVVMTAQGEGCHWLLRGPAGVRLSSVDVGDFDGDGELELALGMNDAKHEQGVGAVMVIELPKPLEGVFDLSLAREKGLQSWLYLADESTQGLGSSLFFADFDADGADDLVIAAPFSGEDNSARGGSVVVIRGGSGKARGVFPVSVADWRFEGSEGARAGSTISTLDFDADGELDLWVVAPGERVAGRGRAGMGFLILALSGLEQRTYDLADPDLATLRVFGSMENSELRSAEPWDVNADGVDDLLLIEPRARPSSRSFGRGYVLYGGSHRARGELDLADTRQTDLVLTTGRGEQLQSFVAADLDGNGSTELVVAVDSALLGGVSTVRVFTLLNEMGEFALNASTALWSFRSAELGSVLSLPSYLPDTNRDGRSELWILEPFADRRSVDQGVAWRVSIP